MDQGKKTSRKTSPKDKANFLEKLFFLYSFPTIFQGFKKDLEETDIHEVVNKLRSDKAGDELEKQWLLDKDKQNMTMFKVMLKLYAKRSICYGLIELTFEILLSTVMPYTISKLVLYFTPGQTELTRNDAYYYAALSILLNFVDSFVFPNYFLLVTELGLLVRTAFCSMMYRKSLKLSPEAFTKFNIGKIVTLMTKDVDTIESFIIRFNNCWIAVIQITVITCVLYNRVGIPAFGGIGVLLLVVPLHLCVGKAIGSMRRGTNKKTDVRLQATREFLAAIKTIKMYTWEKMFAKKISDKRKEEVNKLKHVFYLRALSFCLGKLCTEMAFFALLMLYLHSGENIHADVIYFCISSFDNLRYTIGSSIPYAVTSFAELFAATERIEEFMRAEESSEKHLNFLESSEPLVELNKVAVTVENKEILRNITTTFDKGFNVITGSLGSGKSSLLKTILQDYPISSGELKVQGKLSYASQEPWLFPSSIKHNILFGENYNKERYNKVLQVCALTFDLNLLLNKDETIVENSAMNLSKGQQARINLARAIYRDADIYLLDDCLAALDTTVQKHIFKECIQQFLKNKLCILVTHSVQSVDESQLVIELNSGTIQKVVQQSHFKTINRFLTDDEGKIAKRNFLSGEKVARPSGLESTETTNIENKEIIEVLPLVNDFTQHKISESKNNSNLEKETLLKTDNQKEKNIYHERKKLGVVDFQVYKRYFKVGGSVFFIAVIMFMFFINQYVSSYSEKLVSIWVNIEENLTIYRTNHSENTTEYYSLEEENIDTLKLYAFMLFSGIVLTLTSEFAYYVYVSNAAIRLHKQMINRVSTATLEFFDNNFIGNILNRFSRDLTQIDEHLPFVIIDFYKTIIQVFGLFAVIATVDLLFLIPAIIVLVGTVLLRRFYIPTGRSLKRLESANRSPVIGHINSTLEGLTTIKAYGTQNIVRQEFDRHQNLYTSTYHTSQYVERAFGLTLNSLSFLFVTLIKIKFLIIPGSLAGDVGLALTQASRLSNVIQWIVRHWATLENQMTSVERILEYTDVESEETMGTDINNWPPEGLIKYENVSLTYGKTNETVLRNIQIEILPKEKIGIIGRTGAGKSTIIECLFRLYETKGKITIDGVDTKTVTLQNLRSHLSIIPQDPILFQGTIRSNIDPRNEYPDEEIWRVLEIVKMKPFISDLKLEIINSETTFSTGQKQLLCLARALVKKNKIIILDEATANMDPYTDMLINDIIKKEFSNCTVLVVAHKMENVLDADKIVVMDRGEIVEFDYTSKLLQKEDSLFKTMVKDKCS